MYTGKSIEILTMAKMDTFETAMVHFIIVLWSLMYIF